MALFAGVTIRDSGKWIRHFRQSYVSCYHLHYVDQYPVTDEPGQDVDQVEANRIHPENKNHQIRKILNNPWYL